MVPAKKKCADGAAELDTVLNRIEIEDNNLLSVGGVGTRLNLFNLRLFRNKYKEEIHEHDIREFQEKVI